MLPIALLTSFFCSLIEDKAYREILTSWILLQLHPIKKAFMYLTDFHSNHHNFFSLKAAYKQITGWTFL
jgi:hypothetical protein